MKFCNRLKSLTWNLFVQSSRNRRLRRRRPNWAPITLAAEMLEVRALLSGPTANVTAVVSGTALTMTGDKLGDHDVAVYRVDANHIEIDAMSAGTTINGAASALFALSTVSGITVNLGSGSDSYMVVSKLGHPALNVGSGGILFQGAGGTGENLLVFNPSADAMSILGNVIVQGTTFGSPLLVSGSSTCALFTMGDPTGRLTVLGSVSLNQTGTGSGPQRNVIAALGGDLNIHGSVTETLVQTSSGQSTNCIGNLTALFPNGPTLPFGLGGGGSSGGPPPPPVSAPNPVTGNLTIGQGVTQNATAASGGAANAVATAGTGNVTIGWGVSQNAAGKAENVVGFFIFNGFTGVNRLFGGGGSGNLMIGQGVTQTATRAADNFIGTENSGNVTIGWGVSQTAMNTTGFPLNSIDTEASGSIAIGQGVTQSATGGASGAGNLISTSGAGKLTVGFGVTQTASGAGSVQDFTVSRGGGVMINGSLTVINTGSQFSALKIGAGNSANSPLTIKGNVYFRDQGTGASEFDIATFTANPTTIWGNVTYDNAGNTKNHSRVTIEGSADTSTGLAFLNIKGSLTLLLSNDDSNAQDSAGLTGNSVYLGEDKGTHGTGYGLVVVGVTVIRGGAGTDSITLAEGKFTAGAVIITGTNPGAGGFGDVLTINGSMFGGGVTVLMSGPNAQIGINNAGGYQPTVFGGLFLAIMTGSKSVIDVANGSGSGYSPVKFGGAVIAIGTYGAGDLFKYHNANVIGPIIAIFFTEVPV